MEVLWEVVQIRTMLHIWAKLCQDIPAPEDKGLDWLYSKVCVHKEQHSRSGLVLAWF